MSKGKLEFFSLVGSYRGKQFFPLTLVLREISNKDNWELSHIAHKELYENSLCTSLKNASSRASKQDESCTCASCSRIVVVLSGSRSAKVDSFQAFTLILGKSWVSKILSILLLISLSVESSCLQEVVMRSFLPWELKGSTIIVLLSRSTRILCISRVAILALIVFFVDVNQTCMHYSSPIIITDQNKKWVQSAATRDAWERCV
jgi:hypothetical protein